MKYLFLAVLFWGVLILAAPGSKLEWGPWKEDGEEFREIAIALGRNRIRGCGQFKWRENLTFDDNYWVHCTRDGKRWVAYWVWPRLGGEIENRYAHSVWPYMGEVQGPFRPDEQPAD